MYLGLGERFPLTSPVAVAGHEVDFVAGVCQRASDFLDTHVPRVFGIPDFANSH